jgi:hypothetical protein
MEMTVIFMNFKIEFGTDFFRGAPNEQRRSVERSGGPGGKMEEEEEEEEEAVEEAAVMVVMVMVMVMVMVVVTRRGEMADATCNTSESIISGFCLG